MISSFGNKLRVRVCGLLFDSQDRLLLVEHRALNKTDSYWLPPGGGVEFGETIEEALIREFQEEANLSIKPGNFVRINEYIKPPLHAIELFFEVEYLEGNLKLGSDPEMDKAAQLLKSIKFVSFEELRVIPPEEKHQILREIKSWKDLIKSGIKF